MMRLGLFALHETRTVVYMYITCITYLIEAYITSDLGDNLRFLHLKFSSIRKTLIFYQIDFL